jgi:formiminotetrahydrofolate cyclodeaminase
MLKDLSVHDYLSATKSNSPAPGGGSASAMAGALGAALALMAGSLSSGNERYAAVEDQVRGICTALEPLLGALEESIDKDTEAFNRVMAAYKLPKTTGEEKQLRAAAIQSSLRHAAGLPMEVAETCVKVLALALEMAEIGNPNAISDGAVAGRLAHAGMWGALYNVRVNLASIRDEGFIRLKREKIARLLAEGEDLLKKLDKTVDEKLGA